MTKTKQGLSVYITDQYVATCNDVKIICATVHTERSLSALKCQAVSTKWTCPMEKYVMNRYWDSRHNGDYEWHT